MLIEFEFSVSLISAEPRRWRPKRTPVQALGRLVRIASTTTPTSASGTDHAWARSVAAAHGADAAGDDQAERDEEHDDRPGPFASRVEPLFPAVRLAEAAAEKA